MVFVSHTVLVFGLTFDLNTSDHTVPYQIICLVWLIIQAMIQPQIISLMTPEWEI